MAHITKPQDQSTEIIIMSNGKKHWLVITKDGTWIHFHQITRDTAWELKRSCGIELHTDSGMTDPES